jgi:hypothetical protein
MSDEQLLHDNQMPWWQSRAIWGSLVTVFASLAAMVGWTVDIEATVELIMVALTLAGGVASWWGRVQATRPISKTQVLPGVTLEKTP